MTIQSTKEIRMREIYDSGVISNYVKAILEIIEESHFDLDTSSFVR